MALQGNLRDFSVSEILQLLGTQKKTGCLLLQRDADRAVVFVHDGRVVAAREEGMKPDDPLVRFLRDIQRFSEEQYRGLLAIHKETGRDLEDLLLNGRYMEQDELAGYVERQILDTLLIVSSWEAGNYRFDPAVVWKGTRLVRMSTEGALIEAARRMDERKRFSSLFADPHRLLGVRDLPDPDEPLSEEERELFGIIDGHHTVADVVAAAPFTEYEAQEALHRLMEAEWVEFVGRRDSGRAEPPPSEHPSPPRGPALARQGLVTVGALVVFVVLMIGGRSLHRIAATSGRDGDVFVAAQIRDVRAALELYRREHGAYPQRLKELAEDDWVSAQALQVPDHRLVYRCEADGRNYRLELTAAR